MLRWFHPDLDTLVLSCPNPFKMRVHLFFPQQFVATVFLHGLIIVVLKLRKKKRLYARTLSQSALLLVGGASKRESALTGVWCGMQCWYVASVCPWRQMHCGLLKWLNDLRTLKYCTSTTCRRSLHLCCDRTSFLFSVSARLLTILLEMQQKTV